MFELIESCPEQREGMGWTGRVASGLVHLFLISVAVAATSRVVDQVAPGGVMEVVMPWHSSSPAPTANTWSPGAAPAAPAFAQFQIPITIPDPGVELPPGSSAAMLPPMEPGTIALGTEPNLVNSTASLPLDVRVVDEQPELLSHPALHYPEVLRQAGLEGRVLVEAVLDTLGHAEPGSVRIVNTAHPLFDPEALAVVTGSRYRPARMAGHAVRVRIRVPVSFQLRR